MALAAYSHEAMIAVSSATKAKQESFDTWPPQERPEEGIFILPGGYVADDGIPHVEVELAPVTGYEEEFLAGVPAQAFAANVVTRLLARCIKRLGSLDRIDAALIRDLLVGDRDYLLIKLREMTFGQKVEAIIHCPNARCGKPMDVTLFLDQAPVERKRVAQRFFTMPLSPAAAFANGKGEAQREVEFRLPTGADQETVAAMVKANEARARHQLLARCIRRLGERTDVDAALIVELPAPARDEIEAQMQQLAPQVEIELEAACPECRTPFIAPFDFSGFFFAEMKSNLNTLEREVHCLARHYHWPEKEILSMTRKKRRRYIELLREETERFN